MFGHSLLCNILAVRVTGAFTRRSCIRTFHTPCGVRIDIGVTVPMMLRCVALLENQKQKDCA